MARGSLGSSKISGKQKRCYVTPPYLCEMFISENKNSQQSTFRLAGSISIPLKLVPLSKDIVRSLIERIQLVSDEKSVVYYSAPF